MNSEDLKDANFLIGMSVITLGLAIAGCFITGIAGIILAFMTENSMGLIVSALAFGIVAFAMVFAIKNK